MKTRNKILITAFVGVLLVGGFLYWQKSNAAIITETSVATPGKFRNFTFFASSTAQINLGLSVATTTTATSTNIISYTDNFGAIDNGYFVTAGAKHISLFFQRGNGQLNSGTSTFNIQITPDGTNWVDYHKLIQDVTNTNSQNETRVQFVTLSPSANLGTGTTTQIYSLSTEDSIYGVRCIVVTAGGGESTCKATADW